MQVVGSVLVRNEDVFLERAVRNAALFCDRIHAVDHLSTDRTASVLRDLAREFDHLSVRRARHARISHEVLEPYVGTGTWVLRIDGDELYDPSRLPLMRQALEAGEYDHVFRIQGSFLHCDALDEEAGLASGWLSPPSRPITSLFNLATLDRWSRCPERLHDGDMRFRPGFSWDSVSRLHADLGWDETPLRCLHVCFLRRSSNDDGQVRLGLAETGMYRRGAVALALRKVRAPYVEPRQVAIQADGSSWKLEKYRRGEHLTVDVSAFLS